MAPSDKPDVVVRLVDTCGNSKLYALPPELSEASSVCVYDPRVPRTDAVLDELTSISRTVHVNTIVFRRSTFVDDDGRPLYTTRYDGRDGWLGRLRPVTAPPLTDEDRAWHDELDMWRRLIERRVIGRLMQGEPPYPED